jgi:hypothetical protein
MKKGKIRSKGKKAWRHKFLILLVMTTCLSWAILSSPASAQDKYERFHVRFEAGYFLSDWVGGNFKKLLTSWGYGITLSGSGFFGLGAHTDEYPMGTQGNFFMSFKVDYSLSPRWALRLTVTPAAKWNIEGLKNIVYYEKAENNNNYYNYGFSYLLTLKSHCKSESYYAGFVYSTKKTREPNPKLRGANYAWNVGAGIGVEVVNLGYELFQEQSLIYFGSKSNANFSKSGIGSYVFGELEYFFGRHLSIAGHLSYKYVFPVRFEAFQMTYLHERNRWDPVQKWTHAWENAVVIFPEHKVNFGGLKFGLDIGYHF